MMENAGKAKQATCAQVISWNVDCIVMHQVQLLHRASVLQDGLESETALVCSMRRLLADGLHQHDCGSWRSSSLPSGACAQTLYP